jgi:hypothetical protein
MAQRPDSFPATSVAAALSFFEDVESQLSDPAVYEQFLSLLRDFSKGRILDRRAVKDRAYALLRGHPDLVQRFDGFFTAHEPDRQDPPAPTRPKRERRPKPAADDDARNSKALRYLERVSRRGAGLYNRLLALISDAETTDLNQIYDRAVEIFGENSDLLSEFVAYLPVPTEQERASLWRRRAKKPEEHHAQAPKRKAIAADNLSAAKRARADDRKTTNRRANTLAVADADAPKTSAFREAWEFETTYSKLVATVKRTDELLKQYEPSEDASPPRGRRAFDELFPSRECQQVLMEMYHSGMLGPIRDALEDGARTELALRTINRRLGRLEQLAVKMAMERRDRARVEGRMQKLAVERVLRLRKNQAKQSAGT